ncbi:unnamed protein product, partial [marine sediment metagenome]
MPDVYERIAESFIGASKEVATLYPKPPPATTRFPFAKYFEDQLPRGRRFGEEEEERKVPPVAGPPYPQPEVAGLQPISKEWLKGIEHTINPPSLPAGYGQPATVNIVPDWEYVGTTLTLRSDDYSIIYDN